ncbi:hypothetical protein UZ38_17935 [Bacillus amyloliquefaciens]|nr:hypothetical protein UZ38_17935 [Bacillus amyloliquefaciens]KJR70909.1 hypothetical protein BAGR45_02740 [Bacillus velezensis]
MFTWNGCWCHEHFSDAGGFAARETRPLKPGKDHKKDMNKSSLRTIPQAVFSFTRHAGTEGEGEKKALMV